MLTESQVERSFRNMLKDAADPTTHEKLEELLDQLRPESPLRFRLQSELEEVRESGSRA